MLYSMKKMSFYGCMGILALATSMAACSSDDDNNDNGGDSKENCGWAAEGGI